MFSKLCDLVLTRIRMHGAFSATAEHLVAVRTASSNDLTCSR